jgi:hypothetical protein
MKVENRSGRRNCRGESSGIIRAQIDLVVVVNQTKANSIKPAGSAQYIPVDRRIGKEVD